MRASISLPLLPPRLERSALELRQSAARRTRRPRSRSALALGLAGIGTAERALAGTAPRIWAAGKERSHSVGQQILTEALQGLPVQGKLLEPILLHLQVSLLGDSNWIRGVTLDTISLNFNSMWTLNQKPIECQRRRKIPEPVG